MAHVDPKAEEPKKVEPKAEEPTKVEPKAEEPKTVEPKAAAAAAAAPAAAAAAAPAAAAADAPAKKEKKVDPKKLAKEAAKEERRLARLEEEAERLRAKEAAAAQYKHLFGKSPLIRSTTYGTKNFTDIKDLTAEHVGKTVSLRARLHTTRKQGGKLCFIVLRQAFASIQGLCSAHGDGLPTEFIGFAAGLAPESIIDVEAVVAAPEQPITSTTQSGLELHVSKLHVVSASEPVLPFQFEDAARSAENNEQNLATVAVDTRLNNRWMDMRTPASNGIFRVQSRVGQFFREYMLNNNFWEIHTPKMIGAASEGGANVFKLGYFGKNAYLAQSPQLYKQMALQGDLERVFEVAPVFRAENSNSHRHMTEFIGLDFEMRINEHYYEVLNVAEELFAHIFTSLAKTCVTELAAICEQHPFEPMVFQMAAEKCAELGVGNIEEGVETTDEFKGTIRNSAVRMLRIPFPEGIRLLNSTLGAADVKAKVDADIGTEHERKLGACVKARYGVDFYIMDRYPASARPFYTMPCPDDANYSNSYDMFIRGEEIVSGAQRIHDVTMLEENARARGVDPATLKEYVDSFRLGAWPHGGLGIGCERLVFLYLGLKNIRYASMFPRDPQRLSP
jgi:aspartyl-tRNA synthetase